MIVVTEKLLQNIVHNRQVLKFANRTCHRLMGDGIKGTLKTYEDIGIIDLKQTKTILNKIDKRLRNLGIA